MHDWSQGTPLAYVRELCRYWLDEYDWAKAQVPFNRFPQFRRMIEGLDIHFIHVRSPHATAVPLVMTHGWPGSVLEFSKVIEPLTDPVAFGADATDAFHVVCPVCFAEAWRPTGKPQAMSAFAEQDSSEVSQLRDPDVANPIARSTP